jgi:hypothetical protein
MGYIKEPKGVDFTVLDKEMNEDEKKRLSVFIAKRKLEIGDMHKRIKPSTSKHKKALNSDNQK